MSTQSSTHFFVLNLNYIRPLEEVDRLVSAHMSYIRSGYEHGHFLLSGRKEPRTGGIILARASSREVVQSIIAQDPFLKEGVATYDVTEFLPSSSIDELAEVIADNKL